MSHSLDDRLRSLMQLSKPELSTLWHKLFEKDPPPNIRKDLMQRIIGYRMQELELRPLCNQTCNRLRQVVHDLEGDPHPVSSATLRIKAGTRLARQWKEQVHVVTVEASGYEYKGDHYDSLSEIARLITGTRWSGPAFFGLKHKSELREAQ